MKITENQKIQMIEYIGDTKFNQKDYFTRDDLLSDFGKKVLKQMIKEKYFTTKEERLCLSMKSKEILRTAYYGKRF